MNNISPYKNIPVNEWGKITKRLIKEHPLSKKEIVEVVLKSWNDIFNSKLGSFHIGKDIFPQPQIMSFFLHELVAHYLSLEHKGIYKVGAGNQEKDIHHIQENILSVEIKASSYPNKIYGNRSYAQPQTGTDKKNKDGYYITINFEKFSKKNKNKKINPKILIIRFGYLEHSDWIAQVSATGQQARLGPDVYKYKLIEIYTKD